MTAPDNRIRFQPGTAPTQPLVERVARAICAAAGWNPDEPEESSSPGWKEHILEAQAALDACHAGEMLSALMRLTAATADMLNVYLADEEEDVDLCEDVDHHIAILELRGAFDAAMRVERSLLPKSDGKPSGGAV